MMMARKKRKTKQRESISSIWTDCDGTMSYYFCEMKFGVDLATAAVWILDRDVSRIPETGGGLTVGLEPRP